jgi:hypothetical protein
MKSVISLGAIALSILSTNVFAGNGEVCKVSDRAGQGVTLIWNSDDGTATVNAQGRQTVYDLEAASGGLKVTFYHDYTASGWSKDLGAFKLACKEQQ